jgi:hypothetical protein
VADRIASAGVDTTLSLLELPRAQLATLLTGLREAAGGTDAGG